MHVYASGFETETVAVINMLLAIFLLSSFIPVLAVFLTWFYSVWYYICTLNIYVLSLILYTGGLTENMEPTSSKAASLPAAMVSENFIIRYVDKLYDMEQTWLIFICIFCTYRL